MIEISILPQKPQQRTESATVVDNRDHQMQLSRFHVVLKRHSVRGSDNLFDLHCDAPIPKFREISRQDSEMRANLIVRPAERRIEFRAIQQHAGIGVNDVDSRFDNLARAS